MCGPSLRVAELLKAEADTMHASQQELRQDLSASSASQRRVVKQRVTEVFAELQQRNQTSSHPPVSGMRTVVAMHVTCRAGLRSGSLAAHASGCCAPPAGLGQAIATTQRFVWPMLAKAGKPLPEQPWAFSRSRGRRAHGGSRGTQLRSCSQCTTKRWRIQG